MADPIETAATLINFGLFAITGVLGAAHPGEPARPHGLWESQHTQQAISVSEAGAATSSVAGLSVSVAPEAGKSVGACPASQVAAEAAPVTKEDVQRELDLIYADPCVSDANKAALLHMEEEMPPNATNEQYVKMLTSFRVNAVKAD